MAVITYTAKREIERAALTAAGDDISAAASDNSFNAAATSLAGLAAGEWVLVAGFANAANNGWFQAAAPSSATKLAVNGGAALVDEAAGALVRLTGYKRGFGQSYQIECGLMAADPRARFVTHENIAISGLAEAVYERRDKFYALRTHWVKEAQVPQWEEFFASVAARESFTLDLYGTVAAPSSRVLVCELEGAGYEQVRRQQFDEYAFSFEVRVLAEVSP